MRNAALFFVLLLATFGAAAQTPDEYTIKVHVTSAHFVPEGAGGGIGLRLDVVIDGKKYELDTPYRGHLLALGDYKAKLIKDEHNAAYESTQVYEFLFPDKKTRRYRVVGQSE